MTKRLFLVALMFAAWLIAPSSSFAATDSRLPDLNVFDMRGHGRIAVRQESFRVMDGKTMNGASVAIGNVTGDSKEEIIVAAGPGSEPYVQVYTAKGKRIAQFLAYDRSMKKGVHVAVGNVNAKGYDEIVTVPGEGASSLVRVFTSRGKKTITSGFYAFPKTFTGGATIAVGNVTGSSKAEIVIGSGIGTEAIVRILNEKGKTAYHTLRPFESTHKGGVSVAVANVDAGEQSEIAVAKRSFGSPQVKTYRVRKKEEVVGDFFAFPQSYRGGVNLAAVDVDENGSEELVVVPRQDRTVSARLFHANGKKVGKGFQIYEKQFIGGGMVAAGNVDGDAKAEIVTVPEKRMITGRSDYYKYIDIDLSEQKLRAYRNGVLEKEFAVSTGVDKYPTPTGTYPIRRKLLNKDYEWSYGENHPDNYDIKDVPYNLQFLPTYYLHNAYWHNNFGHKMSHGCVNINLENSKWIYEWANVGDPVIIHQ